MMDTHPLSMTFNRPEDQFMNAFKHLCVRSLMNNITQPSSFICPEVFPRPVTTINSEIGFKTRTPEGSGMFNFSFSLDQSFSSQMTPHLELSYQINKGNIRVIPHEVITNFRSDVPLSGIFGHLTTKTDAMSPDAFWDLRRFKDPADPDSLVEMRIFFEFTTQDSTHQGHLISAAQSKLQKYSQEIEVRSREWRREKPCRHVGLFVFAINLTSYVCNLDSTDLRRLEELAPRISLLVLAGRAVQRELAKYGIDIQDEEEAERLKEWETLLGETEFKEIPGSTIITEELYQIWKSHKANHSEDLDKFMICLDAAQKEVVEECMKTRKNMMLPQTYASELEAMILGLAKKEGVETRVSFDHIIRLPFFEVNTEDEFDDCVDLTELLDLSPIGSDLVDPVISIINYITTTGHMAASDVDRLLSEARDKEMDPISDKRKYRLVKTDIPESDKIKLACRGVEAKMYKDHPTVMMKRAESQKAVDPSSSVEDISIFLTTAGCSNPSATKPGGIWDMSSQPNPSQDWVNDLISDALQLHVPEMESIRETNIFPRLRGLYHQFVNTKIFSWASFVSTVAFELCAAVKKNCVKSQFRLLKLGWYDAYLLVKPTTSESHVFFSIIMRGEPIMESTVFQKAERVGSWWVTPMVSSNMSRLDNLIRAKSMCISTLGYWMAYYGITPEATHMNLIDTLSSSTAFNEFNHMYLLNLLVSIEDRSRTESTITQSRYLMNEGFRSLYAGREPEKVFNSMEWPIRSRLQLYFIERLKKACVKLVDEGFGMEVDESDHVSWKNLFNPFTLTKIDGPHQLIPLYYLGYGVNKDVKVEKNKTFDLVKKIVEEEIKFRKARMELVSLRRPWAPKTDGPLMEHEADLNHMAVIGDFIKDELKRHLSPNFEMQLKRIILKRLASQDMESLVTLKSTSNNSEDYDDIETISEDISTKPSEKKSNKAPKLKTFKKERILQHVANNLDRYDMKFSSQVKISLIRIGQNGKVYIHIFRKPQHGAVREIYVLEFDGRVCQVVSETICKTLCEFFPNELLTNPKNKTRVIQDHGEKIRRPAKSDSFVKNCYSSKDMKRWNQYNNVNKFACLLVRILPEDFHPLVLSLYNMWEMKMIAIPEELVQLVLRDEQFGFRDPFKVDFMAAMQGQVNDMEGIVRPGKRNIFVKSGMLQGIHHYASSLMHVGHSLYCQSLQKSILEVWASQNLPLDPDMLMLGPQKEPACSLFFLNCTVSSDDSATYMSSVSQDKASAESSMRQMVFLDKASDHYAKLYGARVSTSKTVNSCELMVEILSLYTFGNTVVLASNKPVYAALTLKPTDTVIQRFEMMSNGLTDCLEFGNTFGTCYFIQLAQANLHYSVMGLQNNVLSEHAVSKLRDLKDPGLGFFLMDNPYVPGLTGWAYNHWVASNDPKISKKLACVMNNPEVTTQSSGRFARDLYLAFGKNKKWSTMIESFIEGLSAKGIDPEECMEKTVEFLYRRSRVEQETLLKLFVKASNPTIKSALCRTAHTSEVVSAGIYSFHKHVFTPSSHWRDHMSQSEPGKISLLKAMECMEELTSGDKPLLTDSQRMSLFPFQHDYHNLQRIVKRFEKAITTRVSHDVRKLVHIEVASTPDTMLITLEDACKMKWFGIKSRNATKGQLELKFEDFKKVIPWLKDSELETRKVCPFRTHDDKPDPIGLHNFISQLKTKRRMLSINANPLELRVDSYLASLIKRHTWPTLSVIPEDSTLGLSHEISFFHVANCILASPEADLHKKRLLISLSKNNEIPEDPHNLRHMKMAMILKQHRSGKSKEEFIRRWTEIQNCQRGVIGGWEEPQKRRESATRIQWTGRGTFFGQFGSLYARVHVLDTEITSIEVSSISQLRDEYPLIFQWARDQDFTPLETLGSERSASLVSKGVVTSSLPGLPVRENRSLSGSMIPESKGFFSVKVKDYKLSLWFNFSDSSNTGFQVMSIFPNSKDFAHHGVHNQIKIDYKKVGMGKFDTEIVKSIILNKAIPLELFKNDVVVAINRQDEKKEKWIRLTTKRAFDRYHLSFPIFEDREDVEVRGELLPDRIRTVTISEEQKKAIKTKLLTMNLSGLSTTSTLFRRFEEEDLSSVSSMTYVDHFEFEARAKTSEYLMDTAVMNAFANHVHSNTSPREKLALQAGYVPSKFEPYVQFFSLLANRLVDIKDPDDIFPPEDSDEEFEGEEESSGQEMSWEEEDERMEGIAEETEEDMNRIRRLD